jgi:hypothetical protein
MWSLSVCDRAAKFRVAALTYMLELFGRFAMHFNAAQSRVLHRFIQLHTIEYDLVLARINNNLIHRPNESRFLLLCAQDLSLLNTILL